MIATPYGLCHCGCGGKTTIARRTETKHGYRGGRETFAHIYEWEKVNGPTPDGLELDHLCRNPSCCNPAHLEAVTHAENMRRAPRCVMTAESVSEVRRLLRDGHTGRDVGRRLGVHERIVSSIKCGKAWVGVG